MKKTLSKLKLAALGLPGGNTISDPAGFRFTGANLGTVVAEFLKYAIIFAGLAMLIYLILGGFELMTSAGDPKAIKSGQEKVTNAIIGFIVVFAAYWIIQLLQVVFAIHIVS